MTNTAPVINTSDGKILTSFGSGIFASLRSYAYAVALQPDGKFLVAGSVTVQSWTGFELARYNPDGSLDTSFNYVGNVGNFHWHYSSAEEVLVQSDGKIVVVGSGSSNDNDSYFVLLRYNPDGSLDSTFNATGMTSTGFDSTRNYADSAILQPDGKILVGGSAINTTSGYYEFALTRYNGDGSLDTSFSSDGKLTTSLIDASNAWGNGITLQSDGRILLAGTAGDGKFGLVRYNTDGSLDPSFGNDGIVVTDFGAYYASAYQVIQQADGKLIVVGDGHSTSSYILGFSSEIVIVRYNPDGSLDSSFSDDGTLIVDLGAHSDAARDVIQQPDGKLLVAGLSYNGDSYDFVVLRYNLDGTRDSSFDHDGIAQIDFGPYNDFAAAITLQPDGKVLIVGNSNIGGKIDFALARLNSDGSLDSSFQSQPFDYIEDGGAVLLDQGIQMHDTELDALNGGAGDYAGATFTLARQGGINVDDHFGFSTTNAAFTVLGNALQSNGQTFATYTQSNGLLTIAFNSAATPATTELVKDVLQHVTYQNLSNTPPSTLQITWALDDGNQGAQGAGGAMSASANSTVDIMTVNDAPTFTVAPGKITYEHTAGFTGYHLALQPDEKVLVGGYGSTSLGNADFGVGRYHADGTPDTSFGNGGLVTVGFGSAEENVAGITLQADGKIVVVGYRGIKLYGENDFAIARLNPDGSLDTAFGVDGKVVTEFGLLDSSAANAVVLADGKILVAGTALVFYTANDFALVRYNPDGSLDTTFGTDGIVTTDFNNSWDTGRNIIVQSDGKVLVGGTATNASGNTDFALVRYNSDGSLDTGFGNGGKVTNDFHPAYDYDYDSATGMVLQADGKILLTGFSTEDFALARYNSDGSLDTSFSGDGLLTTSISFDYDHGLDVTTQPDGKTLVVGWASSGLAGSTDLALLRYNSDGSLDNTFGGDGIVTTSLAIDDNLTVDAGYSVVVQSDGKILVSGSNGYYSYLIRYNSDGTLDYSFGTVSNTLDGVSTYQENGQPVVLDSDVVVYDPDLAASGNYDGAKLTLHRHGGPLSEDEFMGSGNLGALTESSDIIYYGHHIGTVTLNSNGLLVLTFNSNATQELISGVLQHIAYQNNSNAPAASLQIDWYFNDGNQAGQQGIGGTLSASGSTLVNIEEINDLPLLNVDTSVFAQEGSAVVLDSTVLIQDVELDAMNAGAGNYAGATLTLERQGGATPADVFGFSLAGAGFSISGNQLLSSGHAFATYIQSGGTLTITFTSTATPATHALVQNVLEHITYSLTGSENDAASYVQLEWTFNDGNQGAQGEYGELAITASTSAVIIRMHETLSGGAGNDTLNGDPFATGSHDVISGLNGNDTLSGLAGNDNLNGGAGNDFLNGGSGNDAMDGGAGKDIYIIASAAEHAQAEITDTGIGTPQADEVRFTAATDGETLTLFAGDAGIEKVTLANAGGLTSGITALRIDASQVMNKLTIVGNDGDNILIGTAYGDAITAGAGNDRLIGGSGADTMKGGLGDDRYYVDVSTDKVAELAGQGADTVISSVGAYTLAANFEILVLAEGSPATNGTGNMLSNTITGNSAANVLDGKAGADILIGGLGNDTYLLDNTNDIVQEMIEEGNDSVLSKVSFNLGLSGNHVENLTLSGSASINATGNDLDNTLTGNNGANLLDGGLGADTMMGGAGKDTYFVDNANDSVIEIAASGGIDTVLSSVSFTLGDNLENLTLTGTGDIQGMGNRLANTILGNSGANAMMGYDGNDKLNGGAGNDVLNGGNGNDILVGGSGADLFQFSDSLSSASNKDTISDFISGTDKIVLDHSIFTALSVDDVLLPADAFWSGVGVTKAHDENDHLLFNTTNGALYYDPDGTGSASAIQIATLSGVSNLVASDILVISS